MPVSHVGRDYHTRLAHLRGELLERIPPPVNLHGHAFLQQVHVLEVLAPEIVHLGEGQEAGRLARQTRPDHLNVRQLTCRVGEESTSQYASAEGAK